MPSSDKSFRPRRLDRSQPTSALIKTKRLKHYSINLLLRDPKYIKELKRKSWPYCAPMDIDQPEAAAPFGAEAEVALEAEDDLDATPKPAKSQLPEEPQVKMPTLEDRIRAAIRNRLPRKIIQGEFPSIADKLGVNIERVRDRISEIAGDAWNVLRHGKWKRGEIPDDETHVLLTYPGNRCDITSPMPTHMVRVISPSADGVGNAPHALMMPVHGSIIRANFAHLPILPEYPAMNIYTPYDENDDAILEHEYAQGWVPLLTWKVPNVYTMPHLISYTYLKDQASLLTQFAGKVHDDVLNYLPHFDEEATDELVDEMREYEFAYSQEIATTLTHDALMAHAGFITSLTDNANALGLEDQCFWWTAQCAWRMIMDALILQSGTATPSSVPSRS